MSRKRVAIGTGAFTLTFALWLAVAIPISLYSLFTLEIPLWPCFDAESTREGIGIWAVFVAWYYVLPGILVAVHRRSRTANAS